MSFRISRTLAIAAVVFGVVGQHRAQAATDILRGMVSTAQAPVGAGTILLYDGANLVQSEPYQSFYNGTFAVTLNEAAASALSAGVLRIDVDVDQTMTLMADLGVFDPATQVIFINPVTTITAAYRNLKPATAVATADDTVAEALGVSSPAATACNTVSGFNGPMVSSESVASGGFNGYVQSLAQQIAQGRAPSLRSAQAVPQDFRDFFLETAGDIFSEALGGFPGVKPLAGWILGQIYSAPSESAEQLQAIKGQLSSISGQLNQVLSGISQLSKQIATAEGAILDKIKLTNYQNDAAAAQTYINSLCDMQKQLMYLASLDPKDSVTPVIQRYAGNLADQIQREAGTDLSDIWSDLEGSGVLGTRSLINEWSDLVGPGPGNTIFANVSYLESAVPNLQYYLGAVLVGYNLQIEQAHWIELGGASADRLITDASSSFEQHDDIEMKLVAHNQEIGGQGTTGLYAAVLPPFFAAATQPNSANPLTYNSDPTNAYNWSIDLRTGLMWMRTHACDGSKCTFAMYDQAGGALAQPYIGNLNTTLNNSYPGELFALTAPSRAQWISLFTGLPLSSKLSNPSRYLAAIYFFGTLGNNGFGLPGYDHFWTSDIAREASGDRVYPAWDNFLVDTSVAKFGCCEPTENLELVSPAPLSDPYHFLYRSHQDDFSMNVFTSGPPMSVARVGATATPLLNGKLLIAGGLGQNSKVLNSTELYDPATDKFTPGPAMNTARWEATATLLPNGKVLIAGGTDLDSIISIGLKSTELYDPATNTFAAAEGTATMQEPRTYAAATLLPDGKVLIAGSISTRSLDLYDPYANSFAPSNFQPSLDNLYFHPTATLLPNGKVLIAGGTGILGTSISSTELYDPASNTLAPGPAMKVARFEAAATLLPNGKVLIAGGAGGELIANGGPVPLNSTELYDPATNKFAAGPAMNAARFGAAATLLPNGKFLIAGGYGEQTGVLDSTELYDPATNAFGASNPMNSARYGADMVVLPDSQVLITGGFRSGDYLSGTDPLGTTDLYTE